MDCQEAKRLLHPDTTRDAIWEIADKQEAIKKINEACVIACDAIDELRELRDQGISMERLKNIDFRKEVVEHINYDAYMSLMDELEEYRELGTLEELKKLKECELSGIELAEISCGLNKLKAYRQIGTLDEVREAVEKQRAKKPEKKRNVFTCGAESHSYHCPYCKFRFINKDDTGFYNGMKTKYCPDCGQKLDWSEEE